MINHALSVRSDHSIGESIMQVDSIIKKAKELGYKSVANTDTMSISSMLFLSDGCKKEGIKPIIGCTLRVYDDPTYRKPKKDSGEVEKPNLSFQIKVYVKTEAGLSSLMKLLSVGNSSEYFYYHARVGLEDVLKLEDVVVTTGDLFNVFHHPRHEEIVYRLSQRFETYVELPLINTPLFDTLNSKAMDTSRNLSLPLIASYPTFYAVEEEADTLDVLRAITSNTKIGEMWLPIPYTRDWCFSDPKKMADRAIALSRRVSMSAREVKSALMNIEAIADSCAYEFKKLPPCLPKMAEDEFLKLVEECKKGWATRFASAVLGDRPDGDRLPQYKERLAYELGVLKKLGFANYFLVVQDIVNWSKENGVIVGPGRGSCFLAGHRVVLDKSGVTKSIEDVEVGDPVIAHDGTTRSVVATLSFDRDEEIIDLEFDNSVRISCTKDHKFFTKNRGWVAAEDLSFEDEFDDVSEIARRS